jgi:hypothetical protein
MNNNTKSEKKLLYKKYLSVLIMNNNTKPEKKLLCNL